MQGFTTAVELVRSCIENILEMSRTCLRPLPMDAKTKRPTGDGAHEHEDILRTAKAQHILLAAWAQAGAEGRGHDRFGRRREERKLHVDTIVMTTCQLSLRTPRRCAPPAGSKAKIQSAAHWARLLAAHSAPLHLRPVPLLLQPLGHVAAGPHNTVRQVLKHVLRPSTTFD